VRRLERLGGVVLGTEARYQRFLLQKIMPGTMTQSLSVSAGSLSRSSAIEGNEVNSTDVIFEMPLCLFDVVKTRLDLSINHTRASWSC